MASPRPDLLSHRPHHCTLPAWGEGVFARYRTTQGCRRTSKRGNRFSGSYCKSCNTVKKITFRRTKAEEPTFVIKSRASAETLDGIRRSTFAIRLYVAEGKDPRQH